MTPYEVIGVSPEASEEEIRRAYKKKARLAHPDRHGGDDSLMSALNVAKDILLDPVRRIAYDKHGEGLTPEKTLEQKAVDMLIQCFAAFLKESINSGVRVNYVMRTRSSLETMLARRLDKKSETAREMKALERNIGAVKYRGQGANLFDQFIVAAQRDLQDSIDKVNEEIPIFKKAMEMLDDYQSNVHESPYVAQPGFSALFRNTRL